MSRYWQFLGEYDAVTDTFTEFAGGAGASPYNPVENAKLIATRVVANRDAATSLIDHVQVRLTSTTFVPNAIHCGVQGSGLQTAPALQAGEAAALDWECSQNVMAGTPITLEGRNIGADTQVTVSVLVYGLFDNGKG